MDDDDYNSVLDDVHRHLEGGNAGAAVRAISRHLARHPDCAEAHNDMAVLLHAAGEHASVLDHARRASELDPNNSQYRANYATVLIELGRWQEALAILTKVVERTPLDSSARALLKQAQVAACSRSEAATAQGHLEGAARKGADESEGNAKGNGNGKGSGSGSGVDKGKAESPAIRTAIITNAIAPPERKGIRRELRITANALRDKRVLVIAPKALGNDSDDDPGAFSMSNPNLCWFDPTEVGSTPRGPRTRKVPRQAVGLSAGLPFEKGSFDAVLSAGVMDARTGLQRISTEIRRVLSPNGVLRFQVVSPISQAPGNSDQEVDRAMGDLFEWEPRLRPVHRVRVGDTPSSSWQTTLWSNLEGMTGGVSVLMPVHDTPVPYCEQAVDSILAQTHDEFEFVVVDDGSTDPIVIEYLASLVERDTRIRIVRTTESKGLAHALNVGLSACTGGIVVRMDSDDIARPRLIRKQLDFFTTHPEAVVCGVQIRLFGDVNGETRHPAVVDRWSALNRAGFWLANHPGVGLRRDVILSLGGYGTTRKGRAEDYELWCRVLADGWVIHNQPEVLLDYRSVTKPERTGRAWIEYLESCRDILR